MPFCSSVTFRMIRSDEPLRNTSFVLLHPQTQYRWILFVKLLFDELFELRNIFLWHFANHTPTVPVTLNIVSNLRADYSTRLFIWKEILFIETRKCSLNFCTLFVKLCATRRKSGFPHEEKLQAVSSNHIRMVQNQSSVAEINMNK